MSNKKNKNNNSSNNMNNATVEDLKRQIEELISKNNSLEARVTQLEEKQIISAHVNELLNKEVDRLNQYTRRSNLVIRDMFVPENETVENVEHKVVKMIEKLNLPDVSRDFDKAHRLGKVKEINGKKHQDVIVRFKSHSARYKLYSKRKEMNNVRISPNLTKARSKLLNEAVEITRNIQRSDWGFVFANLHGDLLIRLTEKHKGKQYFDFDSIESLSKTLEEVQLLPK